ncbi:hypothetical protein BDR03DRAFT_874868, partial [Suillus americanus]
DLDEAIDLHRAALVLCFPGHFNQSLSLNDLTTSVHNRFLQRGVLSDLDEVVELHRAALAVCPPGHPDRSTSLNNLANSLQDIFLQWGVLSDLDEAIELHWCSMAYTGCHRQSQPRPMIMDS